MRVDLLTPLVLLRVNQRATITIQVRNDGDVIEQVRVEQLRGELVHDELRELRVLPKTWWEAKPPAVNLFPGEVGELRIELALPRNYPAGPGQILAEITGSVRNQTVVQPIDVDVEPWFQTILVVNPTVITARRSGQFLVTLENRGNNDVEMAMRAADTEAALTLELDRPVIKVRRDWRETSALFVQGKRPWFGAPVSHTIEVTAERLPDVLAERVTLRLKPRLTAGVITALTLATIVAVWATVLLLSANAAFGTDKPTKTVPPNFSKGGVGVADLNPAVVGSAVSGTITAATNGAPLARITVELWSVATGTFVTAVASGSTGAYQLDAVLPGRYRLRFRAEGFEERWYPDATSATEADVLQIQPSLPLEDRNQAMTGLPGTLTTTVVTVDGSTVPVLVTARAADIADAVPVEVPGTTGEAIVFPDLPTPATYVMMASSPGYLDAQVTQQLAAGRPLTANPISLAASAGKITGTVVGSDGATLGDIAISTTVNGAKAVTITPTNGAVGTFSFTGLPTPATYVLELSGQGVATKVVAIPLEANKSAEGETIQMSADTATLTGVVTADGIGLGGATVTVSGGGFSSTAATFTANPPGSYTVTGVPAPGTYVVTVSAPGRVASSSTVTIAAGQTTAGVDAELLPATGRVFGTVTRNGAPIGAATVTVSDGTNAPASTVSATVGNVGGYEVGGLAPGIYSVTATYGAGTTNAPDPVTVLVNVAVNPEQPGQPVVLSLS